MTRKEEYINKDTYRLKKAGRGGDWFSILNKLTDNDSKGDWNITHLEPDKTSGQIATSLAKHFSDITNQLLQLTENGIPKSTAKPALITQLLKGVVAKKLKGYNKPKSTVPGDLPGRVVGANATTLVIPLTAKYTPVCYIQHGQSNGRKKH